MTPWRIETTSYLSMRWSRHSIFRRKTVQFRKSPVQMAINIDYVKNNLQWFFVHIFWQCKSSRFLLIRLPALLMDHELCYPSSEIVSLNGYLVNCCSSILWFKIIIIILHLQNEQTYLSLIYYFDCTNKKLILWSSNQNSILVHINRIHRKNSSHFDRQLFKF